MKKQNKTVCQLQQKENYVILVRLSDGAILGSSYTRNGLIRSIDHDIEHGGEWRNVILID